MNNYFSCLTVTCSSSNEDVLVPTATLVNYLYPSYVMLTIFTALLLLSARRRKDRWLAMKLTSWLPRNPHGLRPSNARLPCQMMLLNWIATLILNSTFTSTTLTFCDCDNFICRANVPLSRSSKKLRVVTPYPELPAAPVSEKLNLLSPAPKRL